MSRTARAGRNEPSSPRKSNPRDSRVHAGDRDRQASPERANKTLFDIIEGVARERGLIPENRTEQQKQWCPIYLNVYTFTNPKGDGSTVGILRIEVERRLVWPKIVFKREIIGAPCNSRNDAAEKLLYAVHDVYPRHFGLNEALERSYWIIEDELPKSKSKTSSKMAKMFGG